MYPSAFVTVRNGTEVTRHIYAAGERVSAVFSDAAGERVYWSHGDAQGSAHYTTNASGAVHEHAEHLPFGEGWVQQSSGTDVGSHRFTATSSMERRACTTWARGTTTRGPRDG